MSEAKSSHSLENTPEGVALKLLYTIAFAEEKSLWSGSLATEKATRKWILDTYAECLRTVQNRSS
jgi:hypothetical protein